MFPAITVTGRQFNFGGIPPRLRVDLCLNWDSDRTDILILGMHKTLTAIRMRMGGDLSRAQARPGSSAESGLRRCASIEHRCMKAKRQPRLLLESDTALGQLTVALQMQAADLQSRALYGRKLM